MLHTFVPGRRAWSVALAAGVAVPLALGGAPAVAQQFTADVGGGVSPVIRNLPKTPRALSLRIDVGFDTNPAGGTPPTLSRAVIMFPYGADLNSRRFPTCTAAKLTSRGGNPRACPSGSRIGTGRVAAVVNNQEIPVQVDLVNGPGGRSILFLFRASTPVNIAEVVQAPLQTMRGGKWHYRLTLTIPKLLQEPVAGLTVGVRRFTATVQRKTVTVRRRGKRERVPLVAGLACPPGAQVPLRGEFSYTSGGSQAVDSFLTCGG